MLIRRRELGRPTALCRNLAGGIHVLAGGLALADAAALGTSFGWVAISFYLAIYLPLFVGLSRVAVHTVRVSPIIAAPVVWTGLELCRAYLLSGLRWHRSRTRRCGFQSCCKSAICIGGYGVCFLIVLVTACVAHMIPSDQRPPMLWPVVPAGVALAATLVMASGV